MKVKIKYWKMQGGRIKVGISCYEKRDYPTQEIFSQEGEVRIYSPGKAEVVGKEWICFSVKDAERKTEEVIDEIKRQLRRWRDITVPPEKIYDL